MEILLSSVFFIEKYTAFIAHFVDGWYNIQYLFPLENIHLA